MCFFFCFLLFLSLIIVVLLWGVLCRDATLAATIYEHNISIQCVYAIFPILVLINFNMISFDLMLSTPILHTSTPRITTFH